MHLIARGAVARYLREIRSSTDRHATWLPGDKIEVGDIRVAARGRTKRVSSLSELGIPFEVEIGDAEQGLRLVSARVGRAAASADADVGGLASGQFRFEFVNEGDFVFEVSSLREHRLASLAAIREHVLEAVKSKAWRSKWLVVEAVYVADCATILVSETRNGELVLEAAAPAVAAESLANPRAGLTVSRHHGRIIQILASGGARPLFAAAKVHGSLFGEPDLAPVRGPMPFREPTVDELLEDE